MELCRALEAQVAAIADDIAYDAHDIDDGLRADLFSLDEHRRGRVAWHDHRRDRAAFPSSIQPAACTNSSAG